ncbi:MAG: hypothetical protein DRJ01_05460 [Bacteroidetes bacterium]|nr:MAG: hypothetical protein DRJ01_05460 [Bacteroidota bacterium]
MKLILSKIYVLLSLILCLSNIGFAQTISKIELKSANKMVWDKGVNNGAKRLIGDVIFQQDDVTMTCDSAYFYSKENMFDAFSNVQLNNKKNNNVQINSDFLQYDGNNKIAKFRNNIVLVDSNIILKTDSLNYDNLNNYGYYFDGGKIIDSTSTLESYLGYYHVNDKMFFFKDSVIVNHQDYTMYTDTLKYNTGTEIVYFCGPTKIVNDTSYMSASNGWYNTVDDVSVVNKDVFYKNKSQKLIADSLYIDRKNSYLKAYYNIEVFDSTQNVILKGDYGDYYENQKKGIITGRALFIQITEGDSLFLHADTLRSEYDSAGKYQILRAYNKVQAYKSDLQLRSDSIVFSFEDSIVQILKNPILWTDNNQITGDKINFHIADKKADYFELINSSFIIAKEDSSHFSQIKGVNMKGFFNDRGKLNFVTVNNKSESIYFPKEKGEIIGVNKSKCKKMNIYLENGQVQKVVFFNKPKQTLYPLDKIKEKELKFKKFKWYQNLRPLSKADIFNW